MLTPRCSREGMDAKLLYHGKCVGPYVDMRKKLNEFASSPSWDSIQNTCDVIWNIHDIEKQKTLQDKCMKHWHRANC